MDLYSNEVHLFYIWLWRLIPYITLFHVYTRLTWVWHPVVALWGRTQHVSYNDGVPQVFVLGALYVSPLSGSADLLCLFLLLLVVCLSPSVCQCRLRLGVADLHSAHLLLHTPAVHLHRSPVTCRQPLFALQSAWLTAAASFWTRWFFCLSRVSALWVQFSIQQTV